MMKEMGRALLTTLLFVFSTGCSIYKSNVRKEFETNSFGRVSGVTRVATAGEHCRLLGPVQTWLENEFPGEEEELLQSAPDRESWLARRADGTLRLKTFETQNDGTLVCEDVFASEREWLAAAPLLGFR